MAKKPTNKLPFGVKIIIGLQIVYTLLLIVDNFVFHSDEFSLFLQRPVTYDDLLLALKLGNVFFQLVIAFGLWRLQRWAWFLLMMRLGVSMSIGLWLYIYSQGAPDYLDMLLHVVMVLYLNQREVQQAFEHKPKLQEAS